MNDQTTLGVRACGRCGGRADTAWCCETEGCPEKATAGVPVVPDHRAVMQQAIDALSMAHAGLEWYRDMLPDQVNGSDDEADEAMTAAMEALQAAIDGVPASFNDQPKEPK